MLELDHQETETDFVARMYALDHPNHVAFSPKLETFTPALLILAALAPFRS